MRRVNEFLAGTHAADPPGRCAALLPSARPVPLDACGGRGGRPAPAGEEPLSQRAVLRRPVRGRLPPLDPLLSALHAEFRQAGCDPRPAPDHPEHPPCGDLPAGLRGHAHGHRDRLGHEPGAALVFDDLRRLLLLGDGPGGARNGDLHLCQVQRAGVFLPHLRRDHFYSLGALLFAFINFWAYIAFSQFLLIWYANLPEETVWFMHRWQNGWQYVSVLLIVVHFAVPYFVLLPQDAKMDPEQLKFMARLDPGGAPGRPLLARHAHVHPGVRSCLGGSGIPGPHRGPGPARASAPDEKGEPCPGG